MTLLRYGGGQLAAGGLIEESVAADDGESGVVPVGFTQSYERM